MDGYGCNSLIALLLSLSLAGQCYGRNVYVAVPTSAPLLAPPDDPVDGGPTFEGDIMGIGPESVKQAPINVGKSGVTDKNFRWPNAVVPFRFSSAYERPENAPQKRFILRALFGFNRTCVRFVTRTNERDYLVLGASLSGCKSYVGKQTNPQTVHLKIGMCTDEIGKVQHEIMHALGFYHEQSRIDRNDYVEINEDNIKPENRDDFLSYLNTTAFGVPYDFDSVMHYSRKQAAVDESVWTIRPLRQYRAQYGRSMGQRDGLSDLDIEKINRMYKCGELEQSTTPSEELETPTPVTIYPPPAPRPKYSSTPPALAMSMGTLLALAFTYLILLC
ncbi:putative Embryonic protein UVS.2 [Hypsibius exemplaris]|uniref:Metalloendopeptidase n=1 Tax=Hypsibius exemplaris TaxID=2072580 RepID=A0A9X6NAH0_HYPEX|nr:putative Embryonic protein UVS.2 [Hypsibius exemplaris]